MPVEIERRFLVCGDEWLASATASRRYRQSCLSKTTECSVRVRRSDGHATITVKGRRDGLARHEFEYRVPVLHADYMLLNMCVTPIVEKVRYWVAHAGMTWEVDVYSGTAAGLVLAEVELERIDQQIELPHWVGPEVTHDPRYRSAGIAQGLWREGQLPGGGKGTQRRSRRIRLSPPQGFT